MSTVESNIVFESVDIAKDDYSGRMAKIGWPKGDPKTKALSLYNAFLLPIENTDKKRGFLYAANLSQANQFYNYNNDQNKDEVYSPYGSGMAETFHHLCEIINLKIKEGKLNKSQVRIFPIPTSLRGGENKTGNTVSKGDLNTSLNYIQDALHDKDNEWVIYGLKDKKNQYAIGGGVSKYFYTTEYADIDGRSQGEFIQDNLNNYLSIKISNHDNPIVKCVEEAVREYTKHNNNGQKFTLFHRHGKNGVNRATTFLYQIQHASDKDQIQDILRDYLENDSNGNTHPHSFRTFLVKELMEELFDEKKTLKQVSNDFDDCFTEIITTELGEQDSSYSNNFN